MYLVIYCNSQSNYQGKDFPTSISQPMALLSNDVSVFYWHLIQYHPVYFASNLVAFFSTCAYALFPKSTVTNPKSTAVPKGYLHSIGVHTLMLSCAFRMSHSVVCQTNMWQPENNSNACAKCFPVRIFIWQTTAKWKAQGSIQRSVVFPVNTKRKR